MATTAAVRACVSLELARAQQILDLHVVRLADGVCLACGTPVPCAARDVAAAVFVRYRRLPRRRPGASRPELVGARRVSAVGRHRSCA